MSAMASQITGVSIVCLTICSGADKKNDQGSASLCVFLLRLQVTCHLWFYRIFQTEKISTVHNGIYFWSQCPSARLHDHEIYAPKNPTTVFVNWHRYINHYNNTDENYPISIFKQNADLQSFGYMYVSLSSNHVSAPFPEIISGMRPANERRRYSVTSSPIGWAHSQNEPCIP